MNAVKTYQEVDKQNDKIRFASSKMESIYLKREGIADRPHRHDFYTVLVVKKALGEHHIDFNTYALGPHQIFFVSPGQVHQLIEKTEPLGYVMTFTPEFLTESHIPLSFIESLDLFHDYGHSPPLRAKKTEFDQIEHFAQEIYLLNKSNEPLKTHAIGAYLKLMLIACNQICSLNPEVLHSDISEGSLVRNFKALVNQTYKTEHSSSYYAEKMHITADHLNRVIKTSLGKTAKEYIQSRVTTEAKRLLFFTSLSTKEIAYELGFEQPANFSAFFKNCSGMSPSNFREKFKSRA